MHLAPCKGMSPELIDLKLTSTVKQDQVAFYTNISVNVTSERLQYKFLSLARNCFLYFKYFYTEKKICRTQTLI